MSALLVGYARCSTDQQDLTAQRDALLGLGVEAERIYVDHGLTGTNRERPGLREALAACRAGDTLVVTKLDRLARSLPDARAIADELTTRQISLSLGGSVYDPADAVGRLLFNVLAMVAEFSDPAPDPRGHEGREGQGPVARQAAQAQPPPGSPPRVVGAQRGVQHPRGGRALRCWPLHRVPRHRTATRRSESRPRGGDIEALTPAQRRRLSRIRHLCGTPAPQPARMGPNAPWGLPCGDDRISRWATRVRRIAARTIGRTV